jgi:hypothetical protein
MSCTVLNRSKPAHCCGASVCAKPALAMPLLPLHERRAGEPGQR